MIRNSRVAAAFLFWLALGIGYAATKAVPPARALTAPVTRPKPAAVAPQPSMPDAQLEKAIRARFAASKISAHHFQVHVQGGVATIEGKTDIVQHKGGATRMAKTAGALAVNNHVEVSEAAKKKASDNLEQGRRRVQVKRGDSRSQTSSK